MVAGWLVADSTLARNLVVMVGNRAAIPVPRKVARVVQVLVQVRLPYPGRWVAGSRAAMVGSRVVMVGSRAARQVGNRAVMSDVRKVVTVVQALVQVGLACPDRLVAGSRVVTKVVVAVG